MISELFPSPNHSLEQWLAWVAGFLEQLTLGRPGLNRRAELPAIFGLFLLSMQIKVMLPVTVRSLELRTEEIVGCFNILTGSHRIVEFLSATQVTAQPSGKVLRH
jgi:hypothetical protein